MPLRRHRLGLSKLKAKLDKLRVKIKGDKPVTPFVVVRLGSGRVQTKALRVGDILLGVHRAIRHAFTALKVVLMLQLMPYYIQWALYRIVDRTRNGAALTTSTTSTLTQRKTWRSSCTTQPPMGMSS